MAYSFSEDTGDGVKKTFTFAFTGPDNGFFNEDMVRVEVDGINTLFTLTGPTQVTLGFAPPTGSKVRVFRLPPVDAPYTDFERGNSFGKININRSFQQQLYVAHRIMDGFKDPGYYEKQALSLGNFKITDVADGVFGTDVATVNQMGMNNIETLAYRNDAEGFANDASGSAADASGSAADANTYAGQALGYRDEASASADEIKDLITELIKGAASYTEPWK